MYIFSVNDLTYIGISQLGLYLSVVFLRLQIWTVLRAHESAIILAAALAKSISSWLICTHRIDVKLLNHSISIKWQKYKNVLTPHQQFGNFVSFRFRFRINFRLQANQSVHNFLPFDFCILHNVLWQQPQQQQQQQLQHSKKMCNKNSRFIHWQSPKMKIFCSPQKTSRIFLLFSFCFVLFGACRIQRDCFCYCCNKRHNSCWTIWISTQNSHTRVCVCMSAWQADSRTERQTRMRAQQKFDLSHFGTNRNWKFPSPLSTLNDSPPKTKTDKQTARLTLETLGYSFGFGFGSIAFDIYDISFGAARVFTDLFWPDWQLSCPVMLRYVKFQMS